MATESHAPIVGKRSPLTRWMLTRCVAIWTNLMTNHLWQRILKETIALEITVILTLIPSVIDVYGKAMFLASVACAITHPGKRFGAVVESVALTLSGALVGLGWSTLGIWLSSLVYNSNVQAAYTIKAVFLVLALFFHGFIRANSPRLFIFVVWIVIVSVVALESPSSTAVTLGLTTTLLYPIITAGFIVLVVNVAIFPEFSSTFLGSTTVETLALTSAILQDAGLYFISLELQDKADHHVEELPPAGSDEEHGENLRGDSVHATSLTDRSPSRRGLEPSSRERLNAGDELSELAETSAGDVSLSILSGQKIKLRAQLAACKAVQQECNFEIAYAVLSPQDLKPINDTGMRRIVASTIALIGACESKYALLGHKGNDRDKGKKHETTQVPSKDASGADSDQDDQANGETDKSDVKNSTLRPRSYRRWKRRSSTDRLSREMADLANVKPRKEIESGDVELFSSLNRSIAPSLTTLLQSIHNAVSTIEQCVAYCYDLKTLPSGARPPRGIELEELDIWIEELARSINDFDNDTMIALQQVGAANDAHDSVDVMPRMETFLISSFMLNLRQAALATQEMLSTARLLVENRRRRNGRRHIYFPLINWRNWLATGGELDSSALPPSARKDVRTGKVEGNPEEDANAVDLDDTSPIRDIESGRGMPKSKNKISRRSASDTRNSSSWNHSSSILHKCRAGMADALEYLQGSEDVEYAFKITVGAMLVSWPAFVSQWNEWFSLNRGLWAGLQFVLASEVAIGNSIDTYILRAIGTSLGCLWGWASWDARRGDPYVIAVMLAIGILPMAYVQLGSQYVKAGLVAIISMTIVAGTTQLQTVPGTATEDFLRRFIAFLIGGGMSVLIAVVLFPVKARDRLVESLAAAVREINKMESCLAYGVESGTNVDVRNSQVIARFESSRGKAENSLAAAQAFLPFCTKEPRLKGSFRALALVYNEILFVLHQIVDKMENTIQLRNAFGSEVLEELNTLVYPYRRNVAGSIAICLFAVHEGLVMKLALPQFLPSARLAHLRMINRVREIVSTDTGTAKEHILHNRTLNRVVQRNFLSWNAASAGQIEIIEYLEELIDLTKLLVGAQEFRSGMLTRPTYQQYVDKICCQSHDDVMPILSNTTLRPRHTHRGVSEAVEIPRSRGLSKRTTTLSSQSSNPVGKPAPERLTSTGSTDEHLAGLPLSLQRMRSRWVLGHNGQSKRE